MSTTSFGIILFACIYSISIYTVVGFGEDCIDDTSCTQNGEVCNPADGNCKCNNNYFHSGSQCDLKVELGGTGCSTSVTDSCKDENAECRSDGTCSCKVGYYDDNGSTDKGTCRSGKILGQTCNSFPGECITLNAQCLDGICTCGSDFYDSNGFTNGGYCSHKVELGGTGCSTNVRDSCKDENAECVSNGGTCSCKVGYYDDNGSTDKGTCRSSKNLGQTCNSFPGECITLNAQCLDGRCTCGSDFYDSNGFTNGGYCSHISDLKVKEINFPADSVTTSGFKVNWIPPDIAIHVNSYVIDWRLKTHDNSLNGGSMEVATHVTSVVISSRVTAGKTYTVNVKSKNNQTQSNVPRTISLSKEQAAKPDKPGAINKSSSDLNASSGNTGITLYWARPSGGVSGYKLTLSDGTNTSSPDSVSEDYTFTPTWLRNGQRYNVTIQAESETYESGNVVLGEVYMEEIKTVVTEPTAPRSVNCKEIFDESIIMEWQSPLFPNGDLVRYTVNVMNSQQANLYTISTSGVTYTLKVENLKPGTWYTFRVVTENEGYNSSTHGEKTCQTKAKLSDPPSNLTVTSITSRNFTVHWDKPNNTYSEENNGYVIQTRVGEVCIKEVVYRCTDCRYVFKPSQLENMCPNSLREVFNRTKNLLAGKQSWQFLSLLPDTMYTISATAVNSQGRGNVAKITQTTNEEVPQFPYSVAVSDITSTSFLVAWNIDGDRPGKTNFTVYITADSPALDKEITVTGFSTRSKFVENLEEYWIYVVSVEATTSLGSRKSSPTSTQRTLPAAPGKVADFLITDAPGGNYTQMKVTWKAPGILQRNSIIKEYKFEYYSEEHSRLSIVIQHETIETYEYTVFVDVRPEQTYTLQVYAVNIQNQDGEKTIESKSTPAGVPINIEDTLQVNIISAYKMIDRSYGMLSVTIVPEFFEESTNGRVRATGLLACAKNCDFSRIKYLQDFNGLRNWKQASSNGFTVYRVTNPAWLTDFHAQTLSSGRRRRAFSNFLYIVGQEDCTDAAPDEYCNGPLPPNTDFLLVAVSCTNGGCLLSKKYGPFSTVPAPKSTVQDCNCSTQTVIVGVVLGLIIIILSLYAGYVTTLNRRYRARTGNSQELTVKKRNKKEELYVNELFTERTADIEGRPSNLATITKPESEYSRLDNATREEKSVYDIIHAM